ncbi:hypothetical protein AALB53_20140 [Lachnospiraceae bacterium 47-T17]
MKSKNTFKKFITCMLIAAIAITGISLESVTTANAATTASYVQKWGTVTMKPGDTKKVIVTDNDGNDITTKYKWTSSDKNIVKVNMDFVSQSDLTECLELIAAGSGTVTLTGKAVSLLEDITTIQLTVTVKIASPTAKQKKCKHKFTVTKKATCERAGVKTCKKCKLQKSIKRTDHKYVNTTVKTTECDGYEYIVMCSCCDCPPFECPGDNCPTSCDFTVVVTTKERGNVIDYPFHYDKVVYVEDHGGAGLDYKTWNDAIQEAVFETADHDGSGHAAYTDSEWAYGEHEVTKTLKVCKYCGKEK